MRKPVALPVARCFRRVESIHPAIESVCAFAAQGATRQAVGMIWMFAQATARRVVAAADVISSHGQSS